MSYNTAVIITPTHQTASSDSVCDILTFYFHDGGGGLKKPSGKKMGKQSGENRHWVHQLVSSHFSSEVKVGPESEGCIRATRGTKVSES